MDFNLATNPSSHLSSLISLLLRLLRILWHHPSPIYCHSLINSCFLSPSDLHSLIQPPIYTTQLCISLFLTFTHYPLRCACSLSSSRHSHLLFMVFPPLSSTLTPTHQPAIIIFQILKSTYSLQSFPILDSPSFVHTLFYFLSFFTPSSLHSCISTFFSSSSFFSLTPSPLPSLSSSPHFLPFTPPLIILLPSPSPSSLPTLPSSDLFLSLTSHHLSPLSAYSSLS